MADIKLKENKSGTIKKLDRAKVYTQRLKDNIVFVKDKTKSANSEETSTTEYGSNKISESTNTVFRKGTRNFNEYGKKSVKETSENMQKAKSRIKKKIVENKIKKKSKQTDKNKVKLAEKTSKRTLKNTPKTTKKTLKGSQKLAKKSVQGAKKAYQIAKATAKITVRNIKRAVKVTISTIKAIIAGTKALIALLVAGGWIVVVVVIVICMIALLVSSVFGIFFSSEDTGSTITVDGVEQSITMSQVVSDLNVDFMNKITEIQNSTEHDEYEISGSRAEWKDVLAVYVAKVSNGDDTIQMITLDDDKVNTLKEIFWAMNEISSSTEEKEVTVSTTDESGNTTEEKVTKKFLYININSKSTDDMASTYNFSDTQKSQMAELMSDEYSTMWSAVIYGSTVGSTDIVSVASAQIGNVGGQTFWSWYGFSSRVEWCAIFVSWCANECRICR